MLDAMWYNNSYVPEEYAESCYSKQTFFTTYSHIIRLSNGAKLWPIIYINPLLMRRALGRPKKLRNKANREPCNPHKLPIYHTPLRCKRCGRVGHNIRICKGKTAADRAI